MLPTSGTADSVVYKICSRQSWLELGSGKNGSGKDLALSRDDERDGYVHLSRAEQVRGTLARHFASQPGLVLLALAVDRIPKSTLVWEASRGGQLFPHLYGALSADLVTHVIDLPLDASGQHQLPEGF